LTVLSWNLFHGRDAPPDPHLFTRRSRWLRSTEENGAHIQVNRRLLDEFASLIAAAQWTVCLLQEVPPTWMGPLAARTEAEPCRVLTSRNQLWPLTGMLARLNPDLVGSDEGGSNLTLVRAPWRIVEGSCRSLLLNPFPERGLRERRRMSFARVEEGGAQICVANLHASTGPPAQTERELRRAARTAAAWAGGAPLVLGGDFNLRPRSSPRLFEELEQELALAPPTAPDAIDHVLVRALEIVSAPEGWPAARREREIAWRGGKRRLRLSDHAPVEATFRARPSIEPASPDT